MLISDPLLADSFAGFVGGNFIMFYLPIWVVIIGFGGAIILFTNMGKKDEQFS